MRIRHARAQSSTRGTSIPVACRRRLVEQEAGKLAINGVQQQLREGNRELAALNLSRESELGELRNQIAIVRCSPYAPMNYTL